MTIFLTSASRIEQLNKKRMYRLIDNELYQDDDGSIYLAWRGYTTDNFTWINSNCWDIRCSHIHDVGCQYHRLVKINLIENELYRLGLLHAHGGMIVCEDIPLEYLEVVDITGHEVNNLFYRMLRDADNPPTPKTVQCLYRAGVSLNLKWFRTVKNDLDLNKIYI
ncbi:MAG: hypothetical protein LUH11_01590 [Candidatus Gastranaerophilales bacterium]|nr:hypothetical protein [Candidatus Gastranaerophilales bacterium]